MPCCGADVPIRHQLRLGVGRFEVDDAMDLRLKRRLFSASAALVGSSSQ
uniref:Uncharacterized protein n=1 Tax=Plectus sambesii TaxID=2011161 RepID=A0A914V8N4_9BILA